jgi:hypothetical protein
VEFFAVYFPIDRVPVDYTPELFLKIIENPHVVVAYEIMQFDTSIG